MPAMVVPINARRQGTYVLLEAALPGRPRLNIGVLLIDPVTDRSWVRIRARNEHLADSEDAEVLEALEEDIRR
jgi:mRNA-degrading endonuclease toxin of MazEF toxin-antitoxin module